VSWPPRPPKFNPNDFYFRSSKKNSVYINAADIIQLWQSTKSVKRDSYLNWSVRTPRSDMCSFQFRPFRVFVEKRVAMIPPISHAFRISALWDHYTIEFLPSETYNTIIFGPMFTGKFFSHTNVPKFPNCLRHTI
jgi:hypothetical protein